MSERITKVQRWLDLVAYLVGRRLPVTVEEIMEGVPSYAEKWRSEDKTARASTRRTFERDKDELRELGIAIETTRFSINYGREELDGYRIARRDFYLPYLKLVERSGAEHRPAAFSRDRIAGVELAEDEARAALDALWRVSGLPASPLTREARSAFRKLAFDLEPDHFAPTPVLYAERPGAAEILGTLRILSDALLARKRVHFHYHGIYRGQATDRDVAPYGLFFQYGFWYLVGHDATRDGIRVFHTARMERVGVNTNAPRTADYEVPPEFRVNDYLDRKAWNLGADEAPLEARVLFRFPASLWAERNGHGELLEERPDGSAVRGFSLQQVDTFLRWLLSLQGDAQILDPPELADQLRSLARDVVAIYAGGQKDD